jgi:methionyl-tRNA synthetase
MDRAEPTRALDLIWQRVRRLNRYVEERAPWELARDPDSAGALEETLASLAEGVRVVSVMLHPYMPQTTRRLLETLRAPDVAFGRAVFAEQGSGATVSELEPLFPKR